MLDITKEISEILCIHLYTESYFSIAYFQQNTLIEQSKPVWISELNDDWMCEGPLYTGNTG